MRAARASLQMGFQDPLSALDPRMPIAKQIAQPLRQFNPQLTNAEIRNKVITMLERVGLSSRQMQRYPHQFSGGQCQRINIARALINRPQLLVCDEAVSALDVSVQAQIIELLLDLRDEFGMAIIFISHDLRVIRQLCEQVVVLRAGRIIESTSVDKMLANPKHSYTQELIAAVPDTPFVKYEDI
jgi:ABC-type microcin C transport system duplicated ATPase subunit YejF